MSNVLSQEEVDSLLKGVSSGEIETETEEEAPSEGVTPYDFTKQEQMLRGRMPALGVVNERFAANFRTNLSSMLRKAVDVETEPVDMVKFEDFRLSLPVPTSLHIFRIDPLVGQSMVVFDGRLVFSLIECYFGGKGTEHARIEGRDFTAIENAMIRKIVRACLEDLAGAWERVYTVKMTYLRSEVNPEFASIVLPGDLVIVIRCNIDIEGVGGHMSLCIPYSTIEPIRERFYGGLQDLPKGTRKWQKRMEDRIKTIPVDIVVELGSTEITAERMLGLQVGDVVQLKQFISDPLVGRVHGIPKFLGCPGTQKTNKALKIEKLCHDL